MVVADVVDSAVETPTTPIVTGALNTSAEAVARPDTPGVRAAAFRESPPAQVVVTTEPEKRQSKGSWLVIAVVAVLVLSVVGIGVWGWNKKESMYHLAVVDNQGPGTPRSVRDLTGLRARVKPPICVPHRCQRGSVASSRHRPRGSELSHYDFR